MKYRKKPIVIEAEEWTGENYEEICQFANIKLEKNEDGELLIPTLEGTMFLSQGNFLIKGVKGELYGIRRDIFFDTYMPVND